MTSVLTLHDVTNSYLSMRHEVAMQAANQMAPKDVDKFFFDQRISLAVVTSADEEDFLARLHIWPGHFCPPRILGERQHVQLFNQNWWFQKRKEDYTRFVLKNVQSQAKAHRLEQQDIAFHLLGSQPPSRRTPRLARAEQEP